MKWDHTPARRRKQSRELFEALKADGWHPVEIAKIPSFQRIAKGFYRGRLDAVEVQAQVRSLMMFPLRAMRKDPAGQGPRHLWKKLQEVSDRLSTLK